MTSEEREIQALFETLMRTAPELETVARSQPEVVAVLVNGSRADVILKSDTGEWRVVFETEDRQQAQRISVYQQPPFTVGVPKGRAVVINGPSGAGKSTVLRALRDAVSPNPWVVFDEPEDVGSVRSEYLIWRDRTPSLHAGYLAAIAALAHAGNQIAVAAGGRSQESFAHTFGDTPSLWVGLRCDLDVLVERERNRPDRWAGLAQASVNAHEGWRYDLEFDTSTSPPPEEIVAAILEALAT